MKLWKKACAGSFVAISLLATTSCGSSVESIPVKNSTDIKTTDTTSSWTSSFVGIVDSEGVALASPKNIETATGSFKRTNKKCEWEYKHEVFTSETPADVNSEDKGTDYTRANGTVGESYFGLLFTVLAPGVPCDVENNLLYTSPDLKESSAELPVPAITDGGTRYTGTVSLDRVYDLQTNYLIGQNAAEGNGTKEKDLENIPDSASLEGMHLVVDTDKDKVARTFYLYRTTEDGETAAYNVLTIS